KRGVILSRAVLQAERRISRSTVLAVEYADSDKMPPSPVATFSQNLHHLYMRIRTLLAFITLTVSAYAGIVDDVREALAARDFSAAEANLNSYRSKQGVTAEYVEAYSWVAREALNEKKYDQATAYAKQTKVLAVDQLKHRKLDAEPQLPLALGAAFEVQ